DPSQNNLTRNTDGTVTYKLAPVSNEPAGTYTAGVWAKTKNDQKDQTLPTVDFQIGTATVETYATGPKETSTCYECHKGPLTRKVYLAHTFPGSNPTGNYSRDLTPVANCQLCHNKNGFSVNPTVRKVHGAHRGHNLTDAGAAHPEYGLPST